MLIKKNKKYHPTKKFLEILETDLWEVETEQGWINLNAIGKTIEYNVWELKLQNNIVLKAADKHIIIKKQNEFFIEEFLCNLKENDIVVTKYGLQKVISIINTNKKEHMYDIELANESKTYYTNDILSHNSFWMCNLAAHSVYNGFNTAYVTLELQREMVNMRIGSNMLNIPLDEYEEYVKDQDGLRTKLNNLKRDSLKPLGNLHVKEFSSSTMSTNDLRTYLVKAQDILGYKFDNVFVDYLNIMKNWRNPNTENLYMKIKQISEDLRAIAQEEQWAIISPTQVSKGGFDATDLTISNVSESSALLHTVDGLFGIIADPLMKARGEYYLKYLADRVSGMENTRKRFEFNRKYGRVEEDVNSQIEDMDFIASSIASFKKPPMHAVISTITDEKALQEAIGGKKLFG
jgi:hypothetical protein